VTTVDEQFVRATPGECFGVAADVESWPRWLSHYRWVRFHETTGPATGRVEMAAWRDFGGPLRYPTWWVSDMHVDRDEPAIFFTHVDGITRGMAVKWAFLDENGGTRIRITHDWKGPDWPLIGAFAWQAVIGPHFVSAIASRTLAGIAREIESRGTTARDTGSTQSQSTPGKEQDA